MYQYTLYLGRFVYTLSLSLLSSSLLSLSPSPLRYTESCSRVPVLLRLQREHVVGSGSARGTVLWWRFANDTDRATRVSGRFRKINEANGN